MFYSYTRTQHHDQTRGRVIVGLSNTPFTLAKLNRLETVYSR